MKAQRSRGTEKTASVRGRKGRKSAKRRKRRKRSGRRSVKRRGNGRESGSVRGRETENGTEIETGTGTAGHAGATLTAATPVEHRTGKGADPEIAGGPGAETRTGRGNANAAGMAENGRMFFFVFKSFPLITSSLSFLKEPGQGQGQGEEAQPRPL